MKYFVTAIAFISILVACSDNGTAQEELDYNERIIADGLGIPWDMVLGPDGYIWFTERQGRLSRVHIESEEVTHIQEIDEVYQTGEGGLLGMALHPDFENEPYIYLVYNYRNESEQVKEKLVRYSWDGEAIHSPMVLIDGIEGSHRHDGSRLWIDPDDMTIYMTTGDAVKQDKPQDIEALNGKTLRINLDGSIPEDNPLPDSPVWSWGHRNAQGLEVVNGIMYQSEHGPNSDDEINIIEKGRNYGWPDVKGYCDDGSEMQFCQDSNVVEPIKAWTPTIAPCGMEYYANYDTEYNFEEFNNSLLLTTLKNSRVYVLPLSADGKEITGEKQFFVNTYGRLRDILVTPEGKIYLSTSNNSMNESIIEITPNLTSVDNGKTDSGVNIFPNPFKGRVNISLPAELTGAAAEIYDQTGNLLKEFKPADAELSWEGTSAEGIKCAAGLYYILIKKNGRIISKPIYLKN
ncbi:MAG: PQQ-dependent sugar dehydrogenase [Candidatus Kapaibacterium sp.]